MTNTITTESVEDLLRTYSIWLVEHTILTPCDQWVEISVPFLDRANDYLQIYVRQDGETLILTDGGSTITDLRQSGCELATTSQRHIIQTILNGFMIEEVHDTLTTTATKETFAQKQHDLIQAMLAVNVLAYISEVQPKPVVEQIELLEYAES